MRANPVMRLITGLALIGAGTTVAAQEWRDALPGEALYEAKQRIETAELNAAADPLEKASVYLQHADRRVDEIRKSIRRDNAESVEALSSDYADAIQRAEEHIARARGQGRDTRRASQQVDKATRKHTEVLTGLLEQVPEQAVPAIRQAREVSLRGRQRALEELRSSGIRDGAERGTVRDNRSFDNENFPRDPGVDSRGGFPGSAGGRSGSGFPGSAGGGGGPATGGPPGR